jgi:hypothetical protein
MVDPVYARFLQQRSVAKQRGIGRAEAIDSPVTVNGVFTRWASAGLTGFLSASAGLLD